MTIPAKAIADYMKLENNIDAFLGRYEAEFRNGMKGFCNFWRVIDREGEATFWYSYGAANFPPKEVIQITEADAMDKISNAVEKGYRKVQNHDDLQLVNNQPVSASGFSFAAWAEKK